MEPDALAPLRELDRPLAPLSRAVGAPESAPVAPQNPAEVLAALMDFSGSVALAELLAAAPPEGPGRPDARERGEMLLEAVRARLDSLLALALKPLTGRRAPPPPRPHELLELLRTHGGDGALGASAAARLADELGAPLKSALATSLRQAQAHVTTLRAEIAHEIRALGPRADRIERIDAALQRSIQAKLGELLDRMEHAAGLTFERACERAYDELGETFGEAELAPWCARSGWIERFRDRCVRMTRALYDHQRRSLEGLLRAAIQAEAS